MMAWISSAFEDFSNEVTASKQSRTENQNQVLDIRL